MRLIFVARQFGYFLNGFAGVGQMSASGFHPIVEQIAENGCPKKTFEAFFQFALVCSDHQCKLAQRRRIAIFLLDNCFSVKQKIVIVGRIAVASGAIVLSHSAQKQRQDFPDFCIKIHRSNVSGYFIIQQFPDSLASTRTKAKRFGRGADESATGVLFQNVVEQIDARCRHLFQIACRKHNVQHVKGFAFFETGIFFGIVASQHVCLSVLPLFFVAGVERRGDIALQCSTKPDTFFIGETKIHSQIVPTAYLHIGNGKQRSTESLKRSVGVTVCNRKPFRFRQVCFRKRHVGNFHRHFF